MDQREKLVAALVVLSGRVIPEDACRYHLVGLLDPVDTWILYQVSRGMASILGESEDESCEILKIPDPPRTKIKISGTTLESISLITLRYYRGSSDITFTPGKWDNAKAIYDLITHVNTTDSMKRFLIRRPAIISKKTKLPPATRALLTACESMSWLLSGLRSREEAPTISDTYFQAGLMYFYKFTPGISKIQEHTWHILGRRHPIYRAYLDRDNYMHMLNRGGSSLYPDYFYSVASAQDLVEFVDPEILVCDSKVIRWSMPLDEYEKYMQLAEASGILDNVPYRLRVSVLDMI